MRCGAGLSPEDVAGYGQVYTGLSEDARQVLFPDAVADLAPGDSFTFEDATRALTEEVVPAVLAQPNVATDAEGSARGAAKAAAADYGWYADFNGAPGEALEPAPEGAREYSTDQVALYDCLHLVERTSAEGEIEGPCDEIYFVCQARTKVGSWWAPSQSWSMKADEKIKPFWHQIMKENKSANQIGDGRVLLLQAWEEDWHKSATLKNLGEELSKIADHWLFKLAGKIEKKIEILGMILTVVGKLLKIFADDHIGDVVRSMEGWSLCPMGTYPLTFTGGSGGGKVETGLLWGPM
ncbi:hypothetical protein SSP35_32_00250 [Streptomyces sp. NBRC 110611]|uniref:hypothetical protein n=1 Tax=Streptomyces sp. NBRC 110611 TaxID=1621259 RepID=UPI000857951D|nr:hypothetical protein [Streptomyces sp. NBRC 110611]GAU71296.1 hypothetical protein SSP35_32_00250 [Streptomyces sp. NBRC 110611]